MERGAVVAAGMATPVGVPPLRGSALAASVLEEPAGVAWEHGRIVYAGPAEDLPWPPSGGRVDAGIIVPGFVDCHVHLPFVGWRAEEFEARLAGRSYRDLHGSDGGIFRSSRLFREASDDEVLAFSRTIAREMATTGTTAMELKTGYGLSVEQELRQARIARRLAEEVPQTCTVTLLAGHAVPRGTDRASWVRAAADELIPAAASEALADQVDVYVEDIAFHLEDLERIAAAAGAAGLPLRVHADQLGPSAAAEAAVRLGARSADHLNRCSGDGVEALGKAPATAAVLLPASTFFMGGSKTAMGTETTGGAVAVPPVGALRAAGAAIAVATDLNPGTSPISSMPEAIAIASAIYGLTPLEALGAATANAAWVLGLHDRLGSLSTGARADLLLLDVPSFSHVPYRPGRNPVAATLIGGELVAGDLEA